MKMKTRSMKNWKQFSIHKGRYDLQCTVCYGILLYHFVQDPLTRAKKAVHRLVERVGFFGILLCASVSQLRHSPIVILYTCSSLSLTHTHKHTCTQFPNPLFDLAGITCGHFLIPFSTFFGATLIGKAIIKMNLQVHMCMQRRPRS